MGLLAETEVTEKSCGSYCVQMTWGCWQRQKLQRRAVEWQEALERKGLKVNAKKREVMVGAREVRVEADISENGGSEEEVRHREGAGWGNGEKCQE